VHKNAEPLGTSLW